VNNWTTPETPSTVAWREAAMRLMRAVMVEDVRCDLTPETLRACDAILHLAGITALGRGEEAHR
jgi:hypothetical protein